MTFLLIAILVILGFVCTAGSLNAFSGRRMLGAVFALLCFSAPAAAQSLHPLYKERDPISEPALVGTWEKGDLHIRIQELTADRYRLHLSEKSSAQPVETIYELRLVRLKGNVYFDVAFSHVEVDGWGVSDFALVLPVHFFGRLHLEADTLTFGVLNTFWLEEEMTAGRIRTPTEKTGTDALLVASTAELQRLVESLPAEAFASGSEALELKRVLEPEETKKKDAPPCEAKS
jgi:hypothetical protein